MPATRAGLVIDGHLDTIHLRKPAPPRGERRIYLGDWKSVPVYDFERLAPEQAIAGPAIIESAMTTVLLRPHDRAQVTAHGWLDIAVPARSE